MIFRSKEIQAGALVVLLHVVGVIGYSTDGLHDYFILLTPYNLLIVATILLAFHHYKQLGDQYKLFVVSVIGWMAEYIGVHYKFLFGEYEYGQTLGVEISGIPLVIGLNWLVLSYCFGAIAQKNIHSKIFSIIAAAVGMVLLDLLIEPVAIKYDYWQWKNGEIPVRNYIGWLMVSILIQLIVQSIPIKKNYKLAMLILLSQMIFFVFLNFL